MKNKFKVFLIVVLVAVIWGSPDPGYSQDALTTALLNKLAQGYRLKVVGDNLVAFTECDTIIKPKSQFTTEELRKISRIYKAYLAAQRTLKISINNEYGITAGDVTLPVDNNHIYFIAREGVLINAVNQGSIAGLDSAKVLGSRRSITTSGGQYYRVIELNVTNADTSAIMSASRAGNIHYLVPFTASLDSLRNYLNNPASVPAWTE